MSVRPGSAGARPGHVALVGAGPQGLAALAALAARGSWPEHVTVVDPRPGWASAWDEKLARLDLDRLRSPQVHHPGPRPMQLRDLVEGAPASEQASLRLPEAERVPTPLGMRRFLDALAAGLGPIERREASATAVRLPGTAGVSVALAGDGPATAPPLHADAVVLAHHPARPRIPGWADDLVRRGRAVHASLVDLRGADLAGREIVVVGGGLTAACLALGALRRGACVQLLTRRPLRERPYDVDASWIGPRRLDPFLRAPIAERRRLIDAARDGGTVPRATLEALRAAAAPGDRLSIREAVDVAEAVHGAPADADVWLATGFANDVRQDELVAPLVEALGVPIHDGLPETDDSLRLGGAPVFVAGPYAALTVGPAARNLAGARPAGARIASALIEAARQT